MLIFWPQRLVVLATPKTGTTSLEAALESLADIAVLRPPALRHTDVRTFRRHVAPYLEAAAGEPFRCVALMREPVEWLGSWYRARRRELEEEGAGGQEDARPAEGAGAGRNGGHAGQRSGGDRHGPRGGAGAPPAWLADFGGFVAAHLLAAPPPGTDVGSQAAFLDDGTGRVGVDRLFRYEAFERFTAFLEGELDCELILPRLNASPARDLTLPPSLAGRLESARQRDRAFYDTTA
jgi:hypothetical protein